MKERIRRRIARHGRIRKKLIGTKEKPRLCVYRGLANLQVQLIDDFSGVTLLSVSTHDKALKKKIGYGGNVKAAGLLGQITAEEARKKGITKIVFDRAGFLYHGRVKSLAEALRKNGLEF